MSYPTPTGSTPSGLTTEIEGSDASEGSDMEPSDNTTDAVGEMEPHLLSPSQPLYLSAPPSTQIPYFSPYIYPSYPSYPLYPYFSHIPAMNGIFRLSQGSPQSLAYPKTLARNFGPNFYQYNYPDLPYEYNYLLQQSPGNIFSHQTENDITLYIPTIYG